MAPVKHPLKPSKLEQFKIHFEYNESWDAARKPFKK
jgi:hypothetical protein